MLKKKNRQNLLEASRIEIDLLLEELAEVKKKLNNIKKSLSHDYVHSTKSTFKPIYLTCGSADHKFFNYKKYSLGKWIWRPKVASPNYIGFNNAWVPKRNQLSYFVRVVQKNLLKKNVGN